jgi:hypothetical protein
MKEMKNKNVEQYMLMNREERERQVQGHICVKSTFSIHQTYILQMWDALNLLSHNKYKKGKKDS